ncbi:uncharacterized, partial [Tachysurus ichikawai]
PHGPLTVLNIPSRSLTFPSGPSRSLPVLMVPYIHSRLLTVLNIPSHSQNIPSTSLTVHHNSSQSLTLPYSPSQSSLSVLTVSSRSPHGPHGLLYSPRSPSGSS